MEGYAKWNPVHGPAGIAPRTARLQASSEPIKLPGL